MNGRKLSIVIGILVIFGGIMVMRLLSNQKQPSERAPITRTMKMVQSRYISNQDITTQLELTGRLMAKNRIELFAEVAGVLKPLEKPFREGNYVKKGQALIQIDDEEFRLNVQAQKSNLMNQITLILPDLKSDYEASYPQWQAYMDAFDPREDLSPLPEPKSDQEKYFVSARNIYNLYFSIISQEARLKKYTITAPFNGIVTESNITEGTLVRTGQKLGEFINPYVYEMEAAANLSDLDFISVGDKAELTSNDIAGTWQGKVIRISNKIDPNTQTARVFIQTSGKNLKEGMYLKAKVRGNLIKEAVELSRDLLVDQNKLFVIKDSALVLIQVEPVRFTTNTAIVRGLEDSSQIVDETVIGAYEGMKVGVYTSTNDSMARE